MAAACSSGDDGGGSFSAGQLSAGGGGGQTTSDSDPGSASATTTTTQGSGSAGPGTSTSTTTSGTDSGGESDGATTAAETEGEDTELDCADGLGNLCGNPNDLGNLAVGDQKMSPEVTIITPGLSDWYKVSFQAVQRPGGGVPTIKFATNDAGAFRFDINTGAPCDGQAASCGDGGDGGLATGLTEWTFADDLPECCTPPGESQVPWPGVLYLRVYRIDAGQTCGKYQLALSR